MPASIPNHAPVNPLFRVSRRLLVFALAFASLWQVAQAQESVLVRSLRRDYFRNGEETLRAFSDVSEVTRRSIVELRVDGAKAALGAVMDTNGLVLTKASEIKSGKLVCWLATGMEADAEVLNVDEEEDVALVRVHARGLKPIEWVQTKVSVGQWAITPGTDAQPEGVGIISALSRHIRPPRAFIGVVFGPETTVPRIESLMLGFGAEKAGLKPGDVITGVNDTLVTNRAEITDMIADFREGQTVHLHVRRGEQPIEASVTLIGPGTMNANASQFMSRRRRFPINGEVSQRADGFVEAIQHDTALSPWLCGGPLVNLDGKAIGLNIARADRAATYALPSELARRIFENLKSMPESPARTIKDSKVRN